MFEMTYQFLQIVKNSIVIALSLLPISAFCQIRINNALYYYLRRKWLAIHSRWSGSSIDVFDILPSIEEDRATVPCTRFSCKYFLINRSIVPVQRQHDPHLPVSKPPVYSGYISRWVVSRCSLWSFFPLLPFVLTLEFLPTEADKELYFVLTTRMTETR